MKIGLGKHLSIMFGGKGMKGFIIVGCDEKNKS